MKAEKFHSASNRVLGMIGIAIGLAFIVGFSVDGITEGEDVALPAIAFGVIAVWAALVRPVIVLDQSTLTLRRPLSSVEIPVGDVDRVDVRRYTVIEAGGRRFTSTAVGRSFVQTARLARAEATSDRRRPDQLDQASFMCQRIQARAEERRFARVAADAGIRRTPAWPEIVLLAVSAVAVLVAIVV